ncbi:MAG: 1-phosphofructokinase family hexose kinase [Thermodesulfobacteriota bacterium]
MKNIVTLTMNPTVDLSATVDQVLAEHKLRCRDPLYEPGGGGINVSRVIRRLGGESLAFYTQGGYFGQLLQDLLAEEDLSTHPVAITGSTRENIIISEENSGRQFRFGMPGPRLEEEEWQDCLDNLSNLDPPPDFIVASGSLPPGVPNDFYARVARVSQELKAHLVLDASGTPLKQAASEGVFLLKPNMRELGILAGRDIQNEADLIEVAQDLIGSARCRVVVVSLGAAGAVLVSPSRVERVRAPTVPIKSKVGAGDSMVAGIVLSLARRWTLTEAVRFGVAAGAAAVMTPGTQLCHREDVERLYAGMSEDPETLQPGEA